MLDFKIYIPKSINIVLVKKGKGLVLLFNNKNLNNFSSLKIDRNINLNYEGNVLYLKSKNKKLKSLYKTYYTLIKNKLEDSVFFYKNTISIKGAGFKIQLSKNKRFLLFLLGFSHIVYKRIPFGVNIENVDSRQNIIKFSSLDRQSLNEFLSGLQKLKRRDYYKGKGIFMGDEVVILKKPKSAEKK
jgi:ribosomal protein L6P/L9E